MIYIILSIYIKDSFIDNTLIFSLILQTIMILPITYKLLGVSYNKDRLYVRIDHILASKNLKVYDCTVDNTIHASDHYPIWCYISLK